MTTPTRRDLHGTTRATWWRRLITGARRVLSLEPVLVQGVARAVLVLAGTLGLSISDAITERTMLVIAAVYAVVEAVTTLWARAHVVPDDLVLTTRDPDVEVVPAVLPEDRL